ncbi:hypothetical protein QF023_003592 [Chryseobacterium sp. SLBN-27]|uniref:T9SS type A sorting domain-containing protein n=1 Tax=Chryseobacterium sp. SLBN-27 TaxID=3042287 RepID=UPI00285C8170|nr:T9SS type A sorting domain-containing protein [Chryseobacterium sp. SLBN-27]MDR6160076.1 hypothetical protein [Chryseobacterium sp. SLBN-27]
MKKIYFLFVALATTTVMFAQTTITQWNFDASSTAPSTGSGTATILVATGTPSFPGGNPSSGKAWSTTGFPAQGAGSGTAGFSFAVSTVGYSNITVSLDIAGSNTGSKYFQMQYTTNGSTWTNVGAATQIGATGATPATWANITNTIPAAADNNANFAVRVVSVFDPANNTTYTPIGASSTYAAGGTARVDNVTISGTSSTLAVSDLSKTKGSFIKNTFVKNEEITFGAQANNVKVYNMFGQVVKTASVKENGTLNVAELQKGNYIVTGTVNNQPVSQKILKD